LKRIRVIPTLLIQNGGLVKSIKFKNHKYVGDPINAVKIFNDKEVDEIVILDISATSRKSGPDFERLAELAGEAFMPMAYGGGITSLDEIKRLVSSGIEKVIINNSAFLNRALVAEGAKYVGSQSLVVAMDVKRNLFGKYRVYLQNGTSNTGIDPVKYAKEVEDAGAGEIMVSSIDRDGTYGGYDTDLIKAVSSAVTIPVIAVGGASGVEDFAKAIQSGASAVAAGSLFVFQLPHRAVLISYPSQTTLADQLYSRFN
jgi:cyclase